MTSIKLRIDLANGILDVEADHESYIQVMDRAEKFLEKFRNLKPTSSDDAEEVITSEKAEEEIPEEKLNVKKTKKKKTSGSTRPANWKMVADLLDKAGRDDLQSFFAEKKPSGQNEKVVVLAHKLKELTGREGFDGNEIFTAFRIVNEKVPGNLSAVFANMTTAGWGIHKEKKFIINFKGEDVVSHELPRKLGKNE